jgi:hypothetical protein
MLSQGALALNIDKSLVDCVEYPSENDCTFDPNDVLRAGRKVMENL